MSRTPIDEGNDRVGELSEQAEANGINEDETAELWSYSDHLSSLAPELRDEDVETRFPSDDPSYTQM